MGNQVFSVFNADSACLPMKAALSGMNIVDIAETFDKLNKEQIIRLFRTLPKDEASEVFACIGSGNQQHIIESLDDTEVGEIMNKLFVDDVVDFIEEMPSGVVRRVLQNVHSEKRQLINQILRYPAYGHRKRFEWRYSFDKTKYQQSKIKEV